MDTRRDANGRRLGDAALRVAQRTRAAQRRNPVARRAFSIVSRDGGKLRMAALERDGAKQILGDPDTPSLLCALCALSALPGPLSALDLKSGVEDSAIRLYVV
mmetsp:Transcript_28222/g.69613  ORF Transcript_28222/g.69613 Transcript_28222/m.69613 type:complete len:103 (-) Transcript_28222:39-347(-)|eukprot:7331585-Prymnesium_polylepis.4